MILFSESGWIELRNRNTWLPYDLDSYPIQLRTFSAQDSDDILFLRFRHGASISGSPKTAVRVEFNEEVEYEIEGCGEEGEITLPAAHDGREARDWTVRKNSDRLLFYCEQMLVFDYTFPHDSECRDKWTGRAVDIRFRKSSHGVELEDTATSAYKPYPFRTFNR